MFGYFLKITDLFLFFKKDNKNFAQVHENLPQLFISVLFPFVKPNYGALKLSVCIDFSKQRGFFDYVKHNL